MKKEPWNLRANDVRMENTKYTFIIFCEDGAVEPAYFDLFKTSNIHVSTIGNKKQHHDQVSYATEYFRESGLLEVDEHGNEVLKLDDGAQVWCVFDRDRNPNDGKDAAFNDSIRVAEMRGINTAWSNDDFELWVLLHFEDVEPEDIKFRQRSKYYERLTKILKASNIDDKVLRNPRFDYYSTMKTKRRFLGITYQLMKPNEALAIERAENLENYHNLEVKTFSAKCPCTMVHKLVSELRRLGLSV